MRIHCFHPRRAHNCYVSIGFYHRVFHLCAGQVPTLDNDCGRSASIKMTCLLHCFRKSRSRLLADQHGKFRNVRRYYIDAARKLTERLFRIGVNKPVAAGSNHYWIQHNNRRGVHVKPRLHCRYRIKGGEHADLDGIHRNVRKHRIKLLIQKLQRRRMDGPNPMRILRHKRRDNIHAITASSSN